MDLLLISPYLSVEERYGRPVGKSVGGHLPPLGLAYVASFLREKGHSVKIIDALAMDMSDDRIVSYIGKYNPSVIGLTALTSMFHRVINLSKKIKTKFPNKPIILGGHHATIVPEEILSQTDNVDLLVIGEGELTMLELMDKIKGKDVSLLRNTGFLKNIKGIAFKSNKKVVITGPREPIHDLDMLPYPALDLLPMHKYIPLPNQYKRQPVVHMVVIRGCPYSCSFCSNNAVFGRKIRARSPESVIKEIAYIIKQYGAKEISFWDDMLTTKKDWIDKFCDILIKEKVDITWTCYARVDSVDKEMLKNMAKAGCWNIFYGYESGSQQLLDNIEKGITLEQIQNANKWTKEAGIEVRASFMLALPGETPELAKKTIDFAKKLSPEYAQFSLTTPYPATKLYNEAEKWGKLDKNFSTYHGWDAVFIPYGYKNKKQILDMERKAVRSFYFRPGFVFNCIRHIKSLEDLKRYMKGLRFLLGFV